MFKYERDKPAAQYSFMLQLKDWLRNKKLNKMDYYVASGIMDMIQANIAEVSFVYRIIKSSICEKGGSQKIDINQRFNPSFGRKNVDQYEQNFGVFFSKLK